MINKLILLAALLSYSVIVSQPFMYMLALKHTQLNLNAGSYTEVRQLIDAAMRSNFKYILYAGMLTTLAMVIMNARNPGSLLFITSAIALICLVADVVLTLKGSLPLNDVINTWSADHYPTNWTMYRDDWFRVFRYRQLASLAGFVSLLIGVVFRK